MTLHERQYDIHSEWSKPKLFGGQKGSALLNCLKCTTINYIELKTSLVKDPSCKNLRAVPLQTIEAIRTMDKSLWRQFVWPIPMKFEHFRIGQDFTDG